MHRYRPRTRSFLPVALAALIVAAVAACSGGAGSSTSTSPSATPLDEEAAVAAVVTAYPEFAGIGPLDPDLIGGCCWYTATPADGGYEVVFRMGWGDCPAGCINEHVWTFDVDAVGGVELVAEGGDPIPPGGIPSGG